MEEQLISPETELLAKEKGFELRQKILTISPYPIDKHGSTVEEIGVTQAFLQKWLREVHKVHVEVNSDCMGLFDVKIGDDKKQQEHIFRSTLSDCTEYCFYTYETALEYGLLEALKLTRKKS